MCTILVIQNPSQILLIAPPPFPNSENGRNGCFFSCINNNNKHESFSFTIHSLSSVSWIGNRHNQTLQIWCMCFSFFWLRVREGGWILVLIIKKNSYTNGLKRLLVCHLFLSYVCSITFALILSSSCCYKF